MVLLSHPLCQATRRCARGVAHLAIVITLMSILPCSAFDISNTARTEHASVSLTSEPSSDQSGSSLNAIVTLTSIPGWHTYYKNPGDVGRATQIQWTLPEGITAGEIEWPSPHQFGAPPLVSYGYEGEVKLSVPIHIPKEWTGDLPLQAKVKWLVCAQLCFPEEADLKLVVSNRASSSLGLGAFMSALVLAFAGGLLLNLMPCVLPVLSIKVFSLMKDPEASKVTLAKTGCAFLLGVLVSFWGLAALLLVLQSAGALIGWGFQLQSPLFVTVLATLFTLLGLNFFGVFEMGLRMQGFADSLERKITEPKLGGRSSDLMGSFASGVLTTLVASPCTAPFLGAGIGFTLGQSWITSMLVFTAMGLGVGLPVTLLALIPGWLRHLPKPGPWMLGLKKFFAFPMFATVVWLAWVLGHQQGVDAMAMLLAGLILIAMSAWLWGSAQLQRPPQSQAGRALQIILPVVFFFLGVLLAWPQDGVISRERSVPESSSFDLSRDSSHGPTGSKSGAKANAVAWQPYSEQALAEAREQGRMVFVNFTAAWCLSCQLNKRTTLHAERVQKAFEQFGVLTLEADWTNADPEITRALAQLHRNAVPVYALYPSQGGEPILLPEVLTPSLVLDALEKSAVRDAIQSQKPESK